MESSNSSLSLYIHVPVCTAKCLYCDFFSVPRGSLSEETLNAVIGQTLLQAEQFLGAIRDGMNLETLFVGGGTPSALPRENLRQLLAPFQGAGLREWTVEANPETLDEELLALCEEVGVSRLSAGIQSLHDAHLQLLGRPGARKDSLRALSLIKQSWRSDLSLDYITGIPGQTVAEVREDIASMDELHPGHVSLYSLSIEPGTGLARLIEEGTVTPNSRERDEHLWFAGVADLERRGFVQYEISNFSLPGKECLHNLRYWRLEPYLGVGPGAVSTLPADLAARAFNRAELAGRNALRIHTPNNLERFLTGRDGFWGMEIETVSPADFLLENLMMGFRLAEGIPASRIAARFGRAFDELFPGLWARWISEGLAPAQGERLRLTRKGRLLLDGLMREIVARVKGGELPSLDLCWP